MAGEPSIPESAVATYTPSSESAPQQTPVPAIEHGVVAEPPEKVKDLREAFGLPDGNSNSSLASEHGTTETKPEPTQKEMDEMKSLLEQIATQGSPSQPHVHHLPEHPAPIAAKTEVPAPKSGILGKVEGVVQGAKAAAIAAVVFLVTKIKTLLNFGIDESGGGQSMPGH